MSRKFVGLFGLGAVAFALSVFGGSDAQAGLFSRLFGNGHGGYACGHCGYCAPCGHCGYEADDDDGGCYCAPCGHYCAPCGHYSACCPPVCAPVCGHCAPVTYHAPAHHAPAPTC